ncbi:MAG: four helix bundle protein [bacterium]|nr:four helix bundle protein [bacterium]
MQNSLNQHSNISNGVHKDSPSNLIHTHTHTTLPIVEKIKNLYLIWFQYYQILPKAHRYTLGRRIDSIFIEIIEATVTAGFLAREKKLPFVQHALRKTDTLKILLQVLWETKSLDDKKYITLSKSLEETGKMLGGWSGQLLKSLEQARDKQNSPNKK